VRGCLAAGLSEHWPGNVYISGRSRNTARQERADDAHMALSGLRQELDANRKAEADRHVAGLISKEERDNNIKTHEMNAKVKEYEIKESENRFAYDQRVKEEDRRVTQANADRQFALGLNEAELKAAIANQEREVANETIKYNNRVKEFGHADDVALRESQNKLNEWKAVHEGIKTRLTQQAEGISEDKKQANALKLEEIRANADPAAVKTALAAIADPAVDAKLKELGAMKQSAATTKNIASRWSAIQTGYLKNLGGDSVKAFTPQDWAKIKANFLSDLRGDLGISEEMGNVYADVIIQRATGGTGDGPRSNNLTRPKGGGNKAYKPGT
jgi:hypothetical protein